MVTVNIFSLWLVTWCGHQAKLNRTLQGRRSYQMVTICASKIIHNWGFISKLQLSSKIWLICPVFLLLGPGCLTSVISPFTITALTVGSCLCCTLIEAFKLKFTSHPSLKWLRFAQYKDDPKVKVLKFKFVFEFGIP